MTTQTCSKCLKSKENSEFYTRHSYCKQCHKEYGKARQLLLNPTGIDRRRKPKIQATEKKCSKCDTLKPASAFYAHATNSDGLQSRCKECATYSTSDYRFRKYRLQPDDFQAMVKEQDGVCAICHHPKKLVIDHDHSTSAVRGLLCQDCNKALGFVHDDVGVLKSAIVYLEKHRPNLPTV